MKPIEERIYRSLLWLYPRRFRERFAEDLVQAFGADRAKSPSLIRFWSYVLWDVAVSATRCWCKALRWPRFRWAAIGDLRFAVRVLTRERGFSILTIGTLALGIGATTSIYAVVDAVLMRSLPYPGAERIVRLWDRHEEAPFFSVTVSNFFAWRNERDIFEAMGAYREDGLNLFVDGEARRVPAVRVTAGLFDVLGVEPASGRTFSVEEDAPGGPAAVVLTHALWMSHFGGRALLGETLAVSGRPHTVVGIMPAGFELPQQPDAQLFVPYGLEDIPEARGAHFLRVLARLAPDTDPEKARVVMDTVAQRRQRDSPDTNEGWSVAMMSLRDAMVGDAERPLYFLLAAVACLFLIALVNVSNLLVGRTMAKEPELALRAALGAGRARIVRQLLTDSLTLALFGGLGGLLVARAVVTALPALLPESLPRQSAIVVDVRLVGCAALLALTAGLVCGVAPALGSVGRALASSGRRFPPSRRLGRALVASEVALATALIVISGLLLRTFHELKRVELGFDVERVLTMAVTPVPSIYGEPHERAGLYRELVERFESLPSVLDAAIVHRLPLDGNSGATILLEGEPLPAAGTAPAVNYRAIGGDYFRVMGMSLLQGRGFTSEETWTTGEAVIVNEAAVKRFWPEGGALGTRIRPSPESPFSPVVGIVSNVRESSIEEEPEPALYLPYARAPVPSMVLALRTRGEPSRLAPAVREVFRRVNPRQPVSELATLETHVAHVLGPPRFQALVTSLFAAVALLLASIGIHGVVSRAVRARAREIGVRMALGARGRNVVSLVLREGMSPVLLGIVCGAGAAYGLSAAIADMTFGVGALDAFSFVGMPLLLLAVALASNLYPALTASRVDPIETLRCF